MAQCAGLTIGRRQIHRGGAILWHHIGRKALYSRTTESRIDVRQRALHECGSELLEETRGKCGRVLPRGRAGDLAWGWRRIVIGGRIDWFEAVSPERIERGECKLLAHGLKGAGNRLRVNTVGQRVSGDANQHPVEVGVRREDR